VLAEHNAVICLFSVEEPIDTLATVTVQIDDEESTVRFVDSHRVQVADPTDAALFLSITFNEHVTNVHA